MPSEIQYWGSFIGLVVLSLILMPATCDPEDEAAGICEDESESAIANLAVSMCCLSIVPLVLAILARRNKGNASFQQQQQGQTVVINNQQMQPQQQFIPPAPAPAPIPPKTSLGGGFAAQRKKAQLDRALKMELRGDLEGAKTAYELAEEFDEAQRVGWAITE